MLLAVPFFAMSHFSNCKIISGVFSSILLSMRYNHLSGITIRHSAALYLFLLNPTLIRVVSSIITVSAFDCSYFVFVPCSRMSCSCDFTAE